MRVSAAWLILALALAIYWVMLFDSHATQRRDASAQTRLRAAQTAQAMALHIDSLIGDIDYMARNLANAWTGTNPAHFRNVVATAGAALPAGALVQVSVADRDGRMVYSSLDRPDATSTVAVSIADREHFKAHLDGAAPRLFISHPVRGRVSQRWSVQFSRPIVVDGRLAGVVVVSISPEYLSRSFHEIFPDDSDVVLLLRDDGSYLARSHRLDEVLGRSVPPERSFLADRAQPSGAYDIVSPVDGVARCYAWHRASAYPVLISLGLDKAHALAPVEAVIHDGRQRNLIGSVLLVIAALWITWLFVQKQRHAARLAESSERLELALSGGDLGAWDWNVSTGVTRFDTRWAQMLGYRVDELAADVSTWEKLVHPDDWKVIHAALGAHLRGEARLYESEHRLRHRDGHWVWVLDRGRVVARDDKGAALRVVGTHLDITERKEAEAVRAELRGRIAKLVAEVPGVIYQYLLRPDGTSHFPYASPGIADIYRVTPEEAAESADKVFANLHPDDVERVSASIRQSGEQLSTWRCEYRVRFADGTVRWLLGQANPERTADGGTLWHGYIHDVTAAHAASEALQRSEERLRLTVAAVRDGLWEWDMRSGSLRWDARCYEMLGLAPDSTGLSIDDWADRLHPADRERTLASLHAQIGKQRHDASVASDEFRMRTASGEWLWVEGRGRVVDWEGAEPLRMIGTYSDISQRVADAQLRRALLDQGAAAIFVASCERRALYANARARELFGLPGEDMTGFDFRRLHVSEASYRDFGSQYGQLRATGAMRCEWPVVDALGRTRWFDASGTLLDPEQPDGAVIWLLIDITERYLAEAALETERMRLTTLLERFPGGVLVEDANKRIVMANESLCQLLDLPCTASALPGLGQDALRQLGGEAGLGWLRNPGSGPQREQRRTIEVVGEGGRNLEIDWVPILREQDDLGHLWLVRDITERKQRETMLATLASTDALTGLPNRRAFMASLEQAMFDRAGEPVRRGVLLMLDIDHFKRINDSYGHPVGDRVLQHVAELIRHSLRSSDVAGRLGGEEFAVLLPGTTLEDGRRLAERLRATLSFNPANTDAGSVTVTVSIGVTALASDVTASAALVRADAALYAAKGAGRNRVCVAEA
ncbi:PAS domain-containing protein [Azoarcus sp. DD4]|uniref:PAS domain-containing protein n=1 Tax=Azoarcus sp. DD4 TaxID=2027405 RepID=UPI00197AF5DE|nr:PAS domain-containing protein [Azoarcus sp. DD4]